MYTQNSFSSNKALQDKNKALKINGVSDDTVFITDNPETLQQLLNQVIQDNQGHPLGLLK